ncbi:hypothetical protein PoB_000516400 [Plakobranchus ocellatus]|uniref:Uncharacterized protein n=1 Tax=Plakobranchus ocellatus TaxID=259542 RepID=A0AAV3Y6V4_9GAST|nr:hypothetical protein PoB_000516400 [Plakobranchus ocellatus]
MAIVGTLALFNKADTGPYWNLMNSSLPYGSFPSYVTKLQSALIKPCKGEKKLCDYSESDALPVMLLRVHKLRPSGEQKGISSHRQKKL